MGEEPTHPKLLDWSATELVRMDWSLKKLHRLIVTSDTYKQASHPNDPSWSDDVKQQALERWKRAKTKDPENNLLSRRHRIRLEGEAIRDAMLLAAKQLSPRKGGPGVRPPLPKELVATLLRGQWKVSPDEEDHYRRSIYLFARRNLRFPIFEAFDRPDGNASCALRSKSTTAPQALILVNSEFSHQMAQKVAAHVLKETDDTAKQIQLCFRHILSRDPTALEMKTSQAFLEEQARRIEETNGETDEMALADFCLALFNVNEFVYVD